ncbi:MAG: DUF1638 domain-containing protein [Capsulimonadaceae bacterium]|nr:DUF1638 domain-containing protein [Capsulimonadaceae bacterium]
MSNERTARIAVLFCAVLEDEIEHYSKDLPQVIHAEKLEQGLHNEPDRLRSTLQATIDRVESEVKPTAIVLGYGLCSRGTEAVTTKAALLVVPRAHDCITLLLGDKRVYANYVREHPGTYWYSPGWNRHHIPPGKKRYDTLYAQYVEKYGEDDAEFLMESEQHWFQAYNLAAYVDLGVGVTQEDIDYTKGCAEWLKWSFDHQRGNPQLLIDLLSGNWEDEKFLVLQPGQTLAMTADDRVITIAAPKDSVS